MIRFLLAIWLTLCCASIVRADELRPGYLEFAQKSSSEWRLVWKAPMRGGILPSAQPILPGGCVVVGTPVYSRTSLALITTSAVRCTGGVEGKRIGLGNFSSAQTDILVRVAPLGRAVQALRLTPTAPLATISARAGRAEVAKTYLSIGIEHILFGYDHLLFVVALVLLLRSFWSITKAVTAFTMAHSITLVGTTLGLFGLPQAPVEALIALSIIFLAVEIVKRRPGEYRLSERLPWVVAFLFGLLHGFGFAGALKEVGLPEGEVPMALFTFNVGVELGQLVIVAATALLLALLERLRQRAVEPAVKVMAYCIGMIAAMWLIERTLT